MCEGSNGRPLRGDYHTKYDDSYDRAYTKDKKMSNTTAKPVVHDAAYKLAKILNSYRPIGSHFGSFDIEELIRNEWFELSTYAHAIHDEQKAAVKPAD